MSIGKAWAGAAAALALGAMVTAAGAQDSPTATAAMQGLDGGNVGQVMIEGTLNGLVVSADLMNLPAGGHAFHIHAVGQCEPPFTSAGGHFNPDSHQHGIRNEAGMHAGDLPNIHVADSGQVMVEHFAPGLSLDDLFDDDGSAMVIHAGEDDYATDPAGAAGDRIACGVVSR